MLSVVTPTFRRPQEARELLLNLAEQSLLPTEVVLVDGAPAEETATELAVNEVAAQLPFRVCYVRSRERGTAVQRNVGIERAQGKLIALLDDDVRLSPDFFARMAEVFANDQPKQIGGVAGYRTNRHFSAAATPRWRWYRRLRLLTTYEPGRYDFASGYPINANLQPPFSGTRPVDFMTTACAVWRREVFDAGLRFDLFFRDYGVLEDAHFSLRAARQWQLVQCGDAHCIELHAPGGRVNRRKIGYKCVVNYYYVFGDIARPLGWRQQVRFWRFQLFELFRLLLAALRQPRGDHWRELQGRLEGFWAVWRGTYLPT
jgi:glycosyltransferase involved in cell wall biosynthesis